MVPGAGDGSDVLTSALAGQALAFQSTKEAHFEEVDGPTECRSLLENAGAPYVLWWEPVRKSTSESGARRVDGVEVMIQHEGGRYFI